MIEFVSRFANRLQTNTMEVIQVDNNSLAHTKVQFTRDYTG